MYANLRRYPSLMLSFGSNITLGPFLHDTYLTGSSDTKIPRIDTELVNLKEVHVRVKSGSEGAAVFDSATALLRGLFPSNTKNREQLADGTVIITPLNGYQYVPGMP
jgi:lysosomal acid phosphatase